MIQSKHYKHCLLGWLVAYYKRFTAYRKRKKGEYNKQTLVFYWQTWLLSGQPKDFLAYLLFRRDLGKPLSSAMAKRMGGKFDRFVGSKQVLLASMCLEKNWLIPIRECKSLVAGKTTKNIQLPAVLSYMPYDALSIDQRKLLKIYTQQAIWRKAFYEETQERMAKGSLCVVGNAGFMRDLNLAEAIDEHALVGRCNNFSGEGDLVRHIGKQIDVWILAQGYIINHRIPPVEWVVLVGPEIQFRRLDWNGLLPLLRYDNNIKVITIPLNVWRSLVEQLEAPPSAGLVFLAFLHHLLGDWQGISVAGFSALVKPSDKPYHISHPKHKASIRHNWDAEKQLLQAWLAEGLHSLHDE
ncbi:MAG: hypothetical protein CR991_02955 [Proteobacteria bacterium]|nr:MAG: hypothetical protein CR991_02955 [Pseudomonadota bacterium]